jgi:hypothetical protein
MGSLRSVLLSLPVLLVVVACAEPEDPDPPPLPEGYEPCLPDVDAPMGEYSLYRTGMPRFCPVAPSIVTMRIGAPPLASHITDIAEAVLPQHQFNLTSGAYFGGRAHAGPYTSELPAGLVALGAENANRFLPSQGFAPQGLVISAMLVPSATAPEGISLDSTEPLPIIPRASFPIDVAMSLWHEEDGSFVAVDGGSSTIPVPAFDGATHQPIINIEQSDTPVPSGRYVVSFSITEAGGDRYEMNLPFTML